jgi:2-polyprenyl-6-methoxyphenol hydroxylase-like FAD-dependent oxidoreductase
LPQRIADKVQFEKKLSNIVAGSSGGGVSCEFADGSKYGPFDMVIGCDGVRSAVKDFIEKGRVASGDTGLYSGIRIKFAVEDGDPAAERATTSKLTQYFGDGGFALSGVYGAGKDKPPATCSFVISLDEGYFGPFKRKSNEATKSVDENVEWTQDASVELEDRRTNMIKQVKALNIPDFQISPSVSKADRLFELGVYIHNPFTLSGWSKELSDGSWAVLVGDAVS